jgi:redox-sensing transcriptional repressor
MDRPDASEVQGMDKDIPAIIVGRLPIYLQALEHLQGQGVQTTSSQELGEIIGISAAQIRKDLSQFGGFGKQGKGYAIAYLVTQLREILKVNRVWDIAVIGAGNLGRAIAHYQAFIHHGFRVALIFDNDPQRINTRIGDFVVQDTDNLVELIQQAGIKIAMLTVPSNSAQAVASDLVKAGIKAILNYAPISLNLPDDVHVQQVDPVIYLQKMTYYLE